MWSSPLTVLVVWCSLETPQLLICIALTFQAQSPSVCSLVSLTEKRRIRATGLFTGEEDRHTVVIITWMTFSLNTMPFFHYSSHLRQHNRWYRILDIRQLQTGFSLFSTYAEGCFKGLCCFGAFHINTCCNNNKNNIYKVFARGHQPSPARPGFSGIFYPIISLYNHGTSLSSGLSRDMMMSWSWRWTILCWWRCSRRITGTRATTCALALVGSFLPTTP